MIASDLNSPDFVGAKNPDELLQVEFYDHAALDVWETEKTGIKTYKQECPFIRISIPGNGHLTVERPADGLDVQKYPKQWLYYQMQTGKVANADNIPGWRLEDWDELDEETVRQLKYLRFYTVEQIAGANDMQIQGIGMGGNGLREKAKRALQAKNSATVNTEMASRDKEIAELKAQVSQLMSILNQAPEEAPKRGRKPRLEMASEE